jgi:hypothetical protein
VWVSGSAAGDTEAALGAVAEGVTGIMATDPLTSGSIGSGWPDPSKPGVPLQPAQDGFHWLKRPDGELTVAQWSPDTWSWIVIQGARRLGPKEMNHMNYRGPCVPPAS